MQGLEDVMIVAVDHHDVYSRAGQRPHRRQPRKAAADDDHAGARSLLYRSASTGSSAEHAAGSSRR
jgi:hypothetical protein